MCGLDPYGSLAGRCEGGDDSLCSVKDGESLDQLSDCQLLKKDSSL
jgi:hypothetical protein